MNRPIPITKSEKKKLMMISGKTVLIMLAIMAACTVFGLIKDDLIVILAIGGFLCLVALILEVKDKIKYCTYKHQQHQGFGNNPKPKIKFAYKYFTHAKCFYPKSHEQNMLNSIIYKVA